MGQALVFSIVVVSSLVSFISSAYAMRSNYRIYTNPGSRYTGLTTDGSIIYTGQSSGAYRQVSFKNGSQTQVGWVYRAAITSSDVRQPTAYNVKENYNVRTAASFNSAVISQTDEKDFRATGVEKGIWREVVSSTGQKGWINRKGVALSRPVLETVKPVEVAKPVEVVKPVEIAKPAEPLKPVEPPVPYTILNPSKPTPKPAQDPAPVSAKESATTAADDKSKRLNSNAECAGFTDPVHRKNCDVVMAKVLRGELPRKSTVFALKTFRETVGSYCGGKTIDVKYRNKCSFMFSDLDKRSKDNSNKSAAYFIDLCAGDSSRTHIKDTVNDFGTNRGSGTVKRGLGYTDVPGQFTTIAGVFMTKGLRAFNPAFSQRNKDTYGSQLGYRQGDPRCEGQGNNRNQYLKNCPVIAMDLARLGGARTDNSKPMHTSPPSYGTSAGCPSIDPDKNWILRQLASQGNSLYIAYTEKSSEKDQFQAPKEVCTKDPDSVRDPSDSGFGAFPNRHSASTR